MAVYGALYGREACTRPFELVAGMQPLKRAEELIGLLLPSSSRNSDTDSS